MSESFARQDRPAPTLKGGEDRFWSIAVAALYWGTVLVGIAGIGFGVWSYLHERAFLARAVHVEAYVTDVELGVDQKKFTTYTPTYEFTDGQGNTWTNTGPADIGTKQDTLKAMRYLAIAWEIGDLSNQATGDNALLSYILEISLGLGDGLLGDPGTDAAARRKNLDAIRPGVSEARERFKKLYGLSVKDESPGSTGLERHYPQ